MSKSGRPETRSPLEDWNLRAALRHGFEKVLRINGLGIEALEEIVDAAVPRRPEATSVKRCGCNIEGEHELCCRLPDGHPPPCVEPCRSEAQGARFECDECALGRDCEKHDPPAGRDPGEQADEQLAEWWLDQAWEEGAINGVDVPRAARALARVFASIRAAALRSAAATPDKCQLCDAPTVAITFLGPVCEKCQAAPEAEKPCPMCGTLRSCATCRGRAAAKTGGGT